jgi:hypothetical protein
MFKNQVMHPYKKIFVITGLFVFTVAGIAATKPSDNDKHYKNLKVLSKDISSEQLERVMYAFERQLGVTCLYCHVNTKNIVPERVDFASDEKNEKKVAREMLKMTMKINKKYFNITIDKKLFAKPVVWCKTCHRGYPVPHI